MTSSISVSKRGNRITFKGDFANAAFKALTGATTKYVSMAKWPAGSVMPTEYISSDEHPTRELAEGVCKMLERDGLGGEKKHFPIWTKVEESL